MIRGLQENLQVLLLAPILLAGPALGVPAKETVAPVAKPNIVLILADDLGYECIGANGGESYHTPVLDKMAQTGMRFEHCYSQPLAPPSLVQILTGIYNVRNYTAWTELDSSQTTFARLLKKAGYVTCMAGSWHLLEKGIEYLPEFFGFDEFYLFRRNQYYWGPTVVINGNAKDFRKEDYGPDIVSDMVLGFIERNQSKPFFLFYSLNLPHDPFLPTPDSHVPDAWKNGTEMKNSNKKYFADMVEYMDKLIGKLQAKLEEQRLSENTMVIFAGKNGTATGISSRLNGRMAAGGKGSMTDAGTHVPLIVHWPAGIQKPGVCSDLVDFTDMLPTMCQVGGATVPAELEVDGRSFLPQLRGEPANPREWCYCWFSKTGSDAKEWARNQRYKLYRTGAFFDISTDALEQHPLADLTPEAAAARTLLQHPLDRYRDARPSILSSRQLKKVSLSQDKTSEIP